MGVGFHGEDHHAKVPIDIETPSSEMRALALRVPEIDAAGRPAARERALKVLGGAPSIPDKRSDYGHFGSRECDRHGKILRLSRGKTNGGRLPARLPVTMALLPRT
jgi:hypothetical protein